MSAGPTPIALADSLSSRIARNFFTHSGHIPLTLLILEALLSPGGYFSRPDPYILLFAGLAQAWVMGSSEYRGRPTPLLGNLVGPLAYTLAEAAMEGSRFFQAMHHQAYWCFGLLFGAMQWSRGRFPRAATSLLLIESVLRAAIPLVMYAVFEVQASAGAKPLATFFDDSAHRFLAIVLLLLGVLLGFAEISLRRSLATIRMLMERLHRYSEWSFGRAVLNRAIADEESLTPQRVDRAVLFMDIRGFTAWGETQTPEMTLSMLNGYYRSVEKASHGATPIKFKYTADEAMVVFADATEAYQCGCAMTVAAAEFLHPLGLGIGAGLHWGPVVEGVLGGEHSRAYDFIGDTVNTAHRLCEAAAPGEFLGSESICRAARQAPPVWREISAKGKRDPLRAAHLNQEPITNPMDESAPCREIACCDGQRTTNT